MKILSSSQKKKITKELNENFGIKNIPYLFLKFGKEKIRLYSGNLSKEELNKLDHSINIESAGLYFAKQEKTEIKLTLEGTQILKPEIKKNILTLNQEQKDKWLKGKNLEIKHQPGPVILKYKEEFLGSGKSAGEEIKNFISKKEKINNQ